MQPKSPEDEIAEAIAAEMIAYLDFRRETSLVRKIMANYKPPKQRKNSKRKKQ